MLHDPFRFGVSAIIQLIAAVYVDTAPSGSATASFTLGSSGMASGGPSVIPSGAASYLFRDGATGALFEVDVSVTAGAFTSGPTGTTNLASTLTWTVTRTTPGTSFATATFVIRPAGGGAALATAEITIEARIDAGSGGGGGGPGGGGGGGGIEE